MIDIFGMIRKIIRDIFFYYGTVISALKILQYKSSPRLSSYCHYFLSNILYTRASYRFALRDRRLWLGSVLMALVTANSNSTQTFIYCVYFEVNRQMACHECLDVRTLAILLQSLEFYETLQIERFSIKQYVNS